MGKNIFHNTLSVPSELCFVAPYSCILQSLDIDVDDNFLYFNCGGLDFRYGYIHDNKKTNQYVCDLDSISIEGSNDIKQAINEQFGICFKEVLCENKVLAENLIMTQLSNKKKVICFADAFFLTYHPQYRKNHGQTILMISDYDYESNNIIVSDRHVTTIPISSYYGPIKMSNFDQALICGENIYDGKKTGIIIYDNFYDKRNISLNIDKQLLNMASRMLSSKDALTGINGIRFFSKDVLKWKFQWDNRQLKSVFNSAYQHIMGRGGPYVSRKAYAEFILQQCNNVKLSDLFLNSAKEWHSLGVKFFRNTIDINKNSLETISESIYEISEIETEIYDSILFKMKK